MGAGTTDADVPKFRQEMEKCGIKCIDDHIKLLPPMEKRIKDVLKQSLK